jgi:hypothetical protein
MFKENPIHDELRQALGRLNDSEGQKVREKEIIIYNIGVTPSLDVMVCRLAEEKGVERGEIIKRAIETYLFDPRDEEEKELDTRQDSGILQKIKLLVGNLKR